MSTASTASTVSTVKEDRVISLGSKYTLAGILENYNTTNPVNIEKTVSITEDDSFKLIDKVANTIKFKEINGDQSNSFEEGKDDKEIKLDDDGSYVGKGKTTIYQRKIDLENPENSTERWVETSTGKVSDGETEQVPNPQGFKNLNESEEPMNFSDTNPNAEIGNTKSDHLDTEDKSKEKPTNTKSILKDLINNVPTKK
jgi:hypothetical protein